MQPAKFQAKFTQNQKSDPKSFPKSYRVLLVEDEGLIARDIAQRLETLGHRVSAIVSTGEEAVEAAPNADLVLMDIRLDGPMDGIEAAEIIRRRFQIPVIFLTAHADRSMVDRAKYAQPCGYIVKPVAPAALHTSIEIAVYKHAMEREVAESEAWLRAVLVSVADAVAVADADGRVRILNPAAEALTGWSEGEAQGQDLGKVVPLMDASSGTYLESRGSEFQAPASRNMDPREGPVALAMLRDAAVPLDRETQLKTREGRSIPIEGTTAPVRIGPARGGNAAIGAVLTLRDVSRRRWEDQQIRQAQKVEAAAKLAAGVAEEYTNLLAVIRAQAERLLDLFGDYPPARQAAEKIRQAAAAAEEITRRLAGFGKRQPAHPEILSPNGVLRGMAKVLETVAGADVKVTVRPGLNAGRVNADEGQLAQLLMNLTMHAGRRCASGGEIRIETGTAEGPLAGAGEGAVNKEPGYVRIVVSYPPASHRSAVAAGEARRLAGGGLAETEDPFDPAEVEDDGLALSVAHNIVTEHNGFFSARHAENSTDHGTSGVSRDGTCRELVSLEVLLPRWIEPPLSEASAPPVQTHTILLVESREIVRAELHKFFEANGLDLLEAADAGEAIALAEVREGPVALVIAPASEAELVLRALEEARPEAARSCKTLCIVDGPDQKIGELRRSYTQAALLERVRALLSNDSSDPLAAAAGTF